MEIDNVDQKEEEEDLERSFINLDISATGNTFLSNYETEIF